MHVLGSKINDQTTYCVVVSTHSFTIFHGMNAMLLLFHLALLPLGPCLQGQLGIVLGLRQGCSMMRWFYQQDTLPTEYGGFTMKHKGIQ